IAGFGFLNAMLYHFPQYLPGNEYLEDDFRLVFGWLSLALSLPVLFYCANDYFITAFKSLRKKIISIDLPIAIGLITLFLQSTWEIFSGNGIGYFDSLTGLVFFLLVGKWYQGKTYQALSFERDYKTYFPVAVTRVKNGNEETVPLEKIEPQDVILVRNQEIIPADSLLLKGQANIDYSFVTGESLPVRKNTNDFIFAGGKQVGEAIELQVQKDVEQSYLTQLWNQNSNKDADAHLLKNTINKVSQYFTLTIIFIALAAGIFWWVNDPTKAVFAFSSVLIIACPCALALTIPFTFGSTMRQFGRRGFYLKNTAVIEQLQKISTLVFDKTGTITTTQSSNVKFNGDALTPEEKVAVKSVVFQSTHPMSKIISGYLNETETGDVSNFKEISGMGVSAKVNNTKILLGSNYFITGKKQNQPEQNTQVWLAINNQVKGHFTIENTYRRGLKKLINDLQKWYALHLISGDNAAEQKNLQSVFPENSNLNFNQLPTDKLNYVEKLQKQGETVLMIGDGLNDAGALNKSDVGIVIADDIYNFSPACDAILQSSNFEKLTRFIRFTNKSMNVVKISFAISFFYNLTGMFFAVQGILSPIVAAILMPLSSITVVAFSTFAIAVLAKRTKL
ncbi:MAG TPA: heavy metal translocating P-type ATPase, partial [Prolixibacteraceae bacterium]|nr:heavy metal translocating P-type ATPase [Prolixibacteraceae bacterium]